MAVPGIPAGGARRIAALVVFGLLILAPLIWIAWSLQAASFAAQSIETQSHTLAALRSRLSALAGGEGASELGEAASVFLPGGTPAVAGATLQRIVAGTVETAGGRLAESEITPVEAEGDPGRVDLRASFETEIAGLQKILFDLESGTPILFMRTLDVQAAAPAAELGDASPPLRVVMLVGGYWEAGE